MAWSLGLLELGAVGAGSDCLVPAGLVGPAAALVFAPQDAGLLLAEAAGAGVDFRRAERGMSFFAVLFTMGLQLLSFSELKLGCLSGDPISMLTVAAGQQILRVGFYPAGGLVGLRPNEVRVQGLVGGPVTVLLIMTASQSWHLSLSPSTSSSPGLFRSVPGSRSATHDFP